MAKNNNLDQNKISLLQELWWCGIIIKLHVFDKINYIKRYTNMPC